MRIGIDCRLWNESGVGRYTRNLVLNLARIDKKNEYVLFILSKNKDEIRSQVQDDPSTSLRLRDSSDSRSSGQAGSNNKFSIINADIRWHTIEEQLKFPHILQRENLDLMHFPYFSVPVFYDKAFVVTIHDLILHHFPTGQASTLPLPIYQFKLSGYKFVIARTAQRASKIITVSNSVKKEIVDHLIVPKSKVEVTYEGVDDALKRKEESVLTLNASPFFLYVGNAYPHKNLERLIEAFKMFLTSHPKRSEGSRSVKKDSSPPAQNDIRFIFVGKEDYFYKRLKQKVRDMDLQNSVVFKEYVSDEELTGLYQNAFALVAPSLMEGFDLPTLEAMTNKCLVLASDIDVHHEICKDAAIYFDPQNINNIEEKMKSVYFNDLNHFSKNRENGLARAKMFSWEKMTRQTIKIYSSALKMQ